MHTDSLFYRLFKQRPRFGVDLLGLNDSGRGYDFVSEDIKQTSFRMDGIFRPPKHHTRRPLIFVEVQYQPDEQFYSRLFTEITLYLKHNEPKQPWYALVIYPSASVERAPTAAFQPYSQLPQIHRIYLDRYHTLPPGAPLTLQWLQLIALEGIEATIEQVKQFHQAHQPLAVDDLSLLETIVAYKIPQLTVEEIKAMLNLADADLKKSRFYQDIARIEGEKAEKRGEKRGKQEGEQIGKAKMLLELISLKFGAPSKTVVKRVTHADIEQLDVWIRRILTANSLRELFE